MNITINTRDNHKTLLADKSDSIYREYYNKAVKEAEYIHSLLKDIEGSVSVEPDTGSWCGETVYLNYKGYQFTVQEDFRAKLFCHVVGGRNYMNIISDYIMEEYNETEIPNYTFYKLTSKKLLSVLDERVRKYKWMEVKANEIEYNSKQKLVEGLELLKRVSVYMGKDIQTHDTVSKSNSITHSILTPFGFAQVVYNDNEKSTEINTNLRNIIEFLDMAK